MNRYSLALGAAAAAALALQPITASATQGVFTYTPPPIQQALRDPAPRCYTYLEGNGFAENRTSHTAQLFSAPNCSGTVLTLQPDQSLSKAVFRSARFLGHGPATGYFAYTFLPAAEFLENPQADHCIDVQGEGHAANRTDKIVLLFGRPGCVGTATAKIKAGHQVFHSRFASIEFVS
ncbi:hypothetical protein ACFYWU_40535 [Streptomyces chrestomyceticus]|uniref:hypothetical protein n=1 Tax=Streptomyces chrestomyceticus TaxID=68185 RepID=UPI003677E947